MRSSYGLLGIVHEVTFAVQRRQKIKYEYVTVDLGAKIDRGKPLPTLQEILEGTPVASWVSCFPTGRRLLVERRRIGPLPSWEIPGLDWLKLRAPDLRLAHRRPGRVMGPLRLLPRGRPQVDRHDVDQLPRGAASSDSSS